jgi:inosose dehydratase
LAAAPITWGVCEIPDWGEVPPAEQVLEQMVVAGYSGTELGSPGFLPNTPEALRRALTKHSLQLVGAFFPLPLSEPDAGRSALDDGEALARLLISAGCDTLVAADGGDARRRAIAGRVPAAELLSPDQWQRAGETLAELARRCAVHGVHVVFHPHAGTYVETPAELDALMTASPADAVALCLDTGHIAYGGGDPVETAARYGERVKHVHVKDVSASLLARARAEGMAFQDAVGHGVFVPLGEGIVDFPALAAHLERDVYDGWWVVEQDIRRGAPWPKQDPLANARESAAYLTRLLSD